MNLLDIIIITALSICLIRGIIRGFLKELISFISVLISIWIANHYQPQATAYFTIILPKGKFIPLISFLSLFIFSLVVCSIIAWAIKALFIEGGPANGLSRLIGAVLGTLKAIIVIYLVIILLTFFLPSKTPLIAKSKLTPIIIRSYQGIVMFISPSYFNKFKQRLTGGMKKLKREVSKELK